MRAEQESHHEAARLIPICRSHEQAIELLTRTLDEEFAAAPDPEPDDALQSHLDLPAIRCLRAVICHLRRL